MKTFKHTPGPWWLGNDSFVDGCIVTAKDRAGMVEICSVNSAYLDASASNDFEREQIANARLIAASPDLLAALKRMLSMHELMMKKVNHGASFYDGETLFEMNEAPVEAKNIITKVESCQEIINGN
jgi:hypothetical protein